MGLLDWLVALFLPDHDAGGDPDLAQGIARIVGGTDPRLKALGSYAQRLAPAAEVALQFSRKLIDALPSPLAANPGQWGQNRCLRALFPQSQEMGRWLASNEELQGWLSDVGAPRCYALLVAGLEEKTFIGAALTGEVLRQDVVQQSVSFVRHRLLAVAERPADYLAQARWQVFDQLVLAALHALAEARGSREELAREASLLQARLLMLRRRQQHLDGALAIDPLGTVAQLEAQLKSNTQALEDARHKHCTLDECLEVVIGALSAPENVVRTVDKTLRVNTLNIVVPESDPEGHDLKLPEFRLFLPEAKQGIALPIVIEREWLAPYRKN